MNRVQKSFEELVMRGLGRITDPTLPVRLRASLNEALSGVELRQVRLNKQDLKNAEQCAGKLQASMRGESLWEMTPEIAVGQLLHRAAEVEAGSHDALDVYEIVDHAIRRFQADEYRLGFAAYWSDLDKPSRAEIRALAATALDALRATLPPLAHLRKRGLPAIPEISMFVTLESGLELGGRVDLTLGGITLGKRTRLLVDLKTGRGTLSYHEDMRFYALLHCLRFDVEPYRVVTLFLPSGTWQEEDVSDKTLFRAADRVVETARVAASSLGDDVSLRPGPYCRYCPRRAVCPESTWKQANP